MASKKLSSGGGGGGGTGNACRQKHYKLFIVPVP
jgi:hypothetical protein